jgi:hypothetical protein
VTKAPEFPFLLAAEAKHNLADAALKDLLADVDSDILRDLNILLATGDQVDVLAASMKALTEPAAMSLPFKTLPSEVYIKGPKYPIVFDRIVTPKFTKEIDGDWLDEDKLITKEDIEKAKLKAHYNALKDAVFNEPLPMTQELPKPKMVEFVAYETVGVSVGHVAGLSKIDFGEEVAANVAAYATYATKPKAIDPPIAVIEVDGQMIYLPDVEPVTLTRNLRGIVLD